MFVLFRILLFVFVRIYLKLFAHPRSKLHKNSDIDDLTLLEKIAMKTLRHNGKIIGPTQDWRRGLVVTSNVSRHVHVDYTMKRVNKVL